MGKRRLGFVDMFFQKLGVDESNVVPMLQYRLRDSIRMKGGVVIGYSEITQFVRSGSRFVPSWACSHGRDLVVDFDCFVRVGLCEAVGSVSAPECPALLAVNDMLTKIVTGIAARSCDVSFDSVNYMLKASYMDYKFPQIQRMYSLLTVIERLDRVTYVDILLELLTLVYIMTPEYILGGKSNSVLNALPARKGRCVEAEYEHMSDAERNFSRLKMASESGVRLLTDSRGVGIVSASLLSMYLFGMHGRSCYSDGAVMYDCMSDGLIDEANKLLFRCVGDDVVSAYLLGGVIPQVGKCYYGDASQCFSFESVKEETDLYPNSFDESSFLFQNAIGVKPMRKDGSFCNCSYFVDYLVHIESPNVFEVDTSSESKDVRRLRSDLLSKDVEIRRLREQLADIDAQLAEKDKGIEALEEQLAVKRGVINNLDARNKDLQSQISSCYSDDDLVENVEDCVSLEDMVAYVNQFKLIIIGGHDDVVHRLAGVGFTNVERIDNCNRVSGVGGDFFVSCTRFTSHKLEKSVIGKYGDIKDVFFRYNGVNVENLVCCAYRFEKNYLEG